MAKKMRKLTPNKETNINLRVDKGLRNLIRRAARKSGYDSESIWMRMALMEVAHRQLR